MQPQQQVSAEFSGADVSQVRKQADAVARGIIMAVLFLIIAGLAVIVWYSKIGPVGP
jgi:hypothetical protein